jgi:hypothetical protein
MGLMDPVSNGASLYLPRGKDAKHRRAQGRAAIGVMAAFYDYMTPPGT